MFIWKIKKRVGLWSTRSEVNTLTPADTSGLTVWATDAGTHKIDGSTLKIKDSWWKHLDVPRELHFFGNKGSTMTSPCMYQRKSLTGLINQCQNSQDWWLYPQIVSMVQVEDKLEKACLFFEETFLVIDWMSMAWKEKRFTLPPPRFYRVSINVFIQGLSKIAAPRIMHPYAQSVPNQIIKGLVIVRGHGWEQWGCWWWCSIVWWTN